MLLIVHPEVRGFDLLRSYRRARLVKLIQQRGYLPCLGGDVDVVETEAKEDLVGEFLEGFVNQRFCHDRSLGVRLGGCTLESCGSCNVELSRGGEVKSSKKKDADIYSGPQQSVMQLTINT